MEVRIFEMLGLMSSRLEAMAEAMTRLEDKLELTIALNRNHLIRVKNNEKISDDMILMGRPYNDFAPEEAYKIYLQKDLDFIFLDVSESAYDAPAMEGTVKIPLKELEARKAELYSKTTPILVISENGVASIMACELLVKMGYYNVNNVSGGHKFWPGHSIAVVKNIA